MPVGAYQGFSLKNNLSESTLDRNILNNLGTSPIADDLSLLFNNKRNTSEIVVTQENIIGDKVKFSNSVSVYSTRTKITVNNSIFYIKDSNGVDQFRLSTVSTLNDTVANPPIGKYVRVDEITFENFINFSLKRKSENNLNTSEDETENLLRSVSPIKYLQDTETNIDSYKFKQLNSLSKKNDFTSSKTMSFDGLTIVNDIDNLNAGGYSNVSPGLFIYDPISQSKIRAFSNNENPWAISGDNTALETTSTNVTIGILTINNSNGIVITLKNSTMKTSNSNASVLQTFTHKIPIKVNGEVYFLFLKQE